MSVLHVSRKNAENNDYRKATLLPHTVENYGNFLFVSVVSDRRRNHSSSRVSGGFCSRVYTYREFRNDHRRDFSGFVCAIINSCIRPYRCIIWNHALDSCCNIFMALVQISKYQCLILSHQLIIHRKIYCGNFGTVSSNCPANQTRHGTAGNHAAKANTVGAVHALYDLQTE